MQSKGILIIMKSKKIAPPQPPVTLEAKVGTTKIESIHVNKVYHGRRGDITAMKDCNLQILENEFVSIVGPSGCGKSTLLRMLAGLDFPTGGAIVIDDRSVTGPGKDRGMVFQTYTLFPWKTVEKNIRFGLQLNKVPKEEQNRVTEKYLGLIGLTEFRNSYPKELSGGMKQRVAIARSLANNPEVLLMDEPFGALDPQTKASMQLMLRHIWQEEKPTIAFVTHDIEEAVFLSTKIYVMSARPGTVKEVVDVFLPYDRTLELKDTSEFIKIRRYVANLLDKQEISDG